MRKPRNEDPICCLRAVEFDFFLHRVFGGLGTDISDIVGSPVGIYGQRKGLDLASECRMRSTVTYLLIFLLLTLGSSCELSRYLCREDTW